MISNGGRAFRLFQELEDSTEKVTQRLMTVRREIGHLVSNGEEHIQPMTPEEQEAWRRDMEALEGAVDDFRKKCAEVIHYTTVPRTWRDGLT